MSKQEKPPLWKYVTVLEKIPGGGNVRFQCNFCSVVIVGSYPRVKGHLMKVVGSGSRSCAKVTAEHLAEMKKSIEEYELKLRNLLPKQVPLPPSASRTRSSSSSASTASTMGVFEPFEASLSKRKRGTGESPIEKAYNMKARDELTSVIARMFYSGGLPFNLAKNPYYYLAFSMATAQSKNLSSYIPPGYNALRTTLLQRERANIERLLEPIKSTWNDKGVSVVSGGWTDAQRRPIINFMAASEIGPMFLKAVNCQGVYKDKHFIANLIKETIQSIGPLNVVQVITDNAPVCRGAGLLVEEVYPHIFWTPCVVHTLNLALKNICAAKNTEANSETYSECNWITKVVGDVMVVKNFIMNHSMRLSMFNEYSHLKLLSVAETRFASSIIMLRRFKVIKQGLLNMVISPNWANYREDDVGKAAFVKEKILDDLWWDNIDYILAFTEPMYEMLRKADTDQPCLHLVYDMWDSMIRKVKIAIYSHEKKLDYESSDFYVVVHRILVARWTKSSTPLHCLAHSLNPKYYSAKWLNECPTRVAPHKDDGISAERLKCFARYFPNEDERRRVNTEFAYFSAALKEFGNSESIENRGYMEPNVWWVSYGATTPLLQSLALKLVGQPCSSSCCERNWSTYSFINSLKRNKITPQRGEDLVFVHSNLRLLSRKSKEYKEGVTTMWDIGGDTFDSLEGVGILEIADLSLDEPEMEAMLFTNETTSIEDELNRIGEEAEEGEEN